MNKQLVMDEVGWFGLAMTDSNKSGINNKK